VRLNLTDNKIMKLNLYLIQTLIFFVCFSCISNAQNVTVAKEHVKNLCSASFSGRGYTNEGHLKAANYISDIWKQQGLNPFFEESYFQSFKVNAKNSLSNLHLKE